MCPNFHHQFFISSSENRSASDLRIQCIFQGIQIRKPTQMKINRNLLELEVSKQAKSCFIDPWNSKCFAKFRLNLQIIVKRLSTVSAKQTFLWWLCLDFQGKLLRYPVCEMTSQPAAFCEIRGTHGMQIFLKRAGRSGFAEREDQHPTHQRQMDWGKEETTKQTNMTDSDGMTNDSSSRYVL